MAFQLPLIAQIKAARLPDPEQEYRFALPRKWAFDLAWPQRKLAVEIEGGLFKEGGGRHNRGAGYEKDLAKYNAAAVKGWMLLRFSTGMVKSGEALRVIAEVLR